VDGITLVSATSFDPSKNSRVTGQSDYFEVLRARGKISGCCGLSGTWQTATYFTSSSSSLFDWGMSTGKFSLALSDMLSGYVELVVRSGDLGDEKVELSFGVTAKW